MSYKPDGYTDVSAYFLVEDADAMLSFLAATFDAHKLRDITKPDGSGRHVEAQIGDSVVMMGEGFGSQPTDIHVYVEDVDQTYARAIKAGGRSVQEPAQADDPDKRAGVTGPSQVTFWFATQQS